MELRQHKLAKTTPYVRKAIQESKESVLVLASRYSVNPTTIRRWRERQEVYDRSHRPHRLQTKLTQVEEETIVSLRENVHLSLDDITEVMKRCINEKISRSAVHRCLQRHNVSARSKPAAKVVGKFEETTCGFIHMDVKYLTKLEGQRSYVYVAIDRATRFVYAEVLMDLKPETAKAFVARFVQHFPHPVHTILTDNGFEWTDKFDGNRVKQGLKEPSGQHPVDLFCAQNNIKRKRSKPFHPQTNGMVERFNRRINEAIAAKEKSSNNQGKNSFESHQQRNLFIANFVQLYNNTRLKCLLYNSPNQKIANLQGLNTKAGVQKFFRYLSGLV